MSKRRPMSDNPARRVIRINPPSQIVKQFGARHQGGTGILRRLHQHFVVTGLGDHHEPAVAQACDRRQRRFGKPRPFGPAGPRLQSEVLGAPENLRCADLVCSEPMADLLAIRRNTLEMQ